MKRIFYVKLKTGEDIIGEEFFYEGPTSVVIALSNPVQFIFEDTGSVFAKSWCLFSQDNMAIFKREDTYIISPANDKAIEYYRSFTTSREESSPLIQSSLREKLH